MKYKHIVDTAVDPMPTVNILLARYTVQMYRLSGSNRAYYYIVMVKKQDVKKWEASLQPQYQLKQKYNHRGTPVFIQFLRTTVPIGKYCSGKEHNRFRQRVRPCQLLLQLLSDLPLLSPNNKLFQSWIKHFEKLNYSTAFFPVLI